MYDDGDPRLHRDISSLTSDLDDVHSDVRQLQNEVADLNEIGRRVDDLEVGIQRLQTSVDWLESHVRSFDGAPEANLQPEDEELDAMVRVIEAGAAVEAQLRPEHEVSAARRDVDVHAQYAREHQTAVATLLDSCTALTDLDWKHPDHTDARSAYRTAKSDWEEVTSRLTSTTPAANAGRVILADDQVARTASIDTVVAGRDNEARLLIRLRTRISDAVSTRQLLPIWLSATLGPMPPRGRVDEWLEAATDLLRYRVTYEIHDPVAPVGPVPPDASPRRRTRAAQLRHTATKVAAWRPGSG